MPDAMTDEEFRNALDKVGTTQVGAARLFGIDPRTARYYALGEYPVPRPIALALRLMLNYGVKIEEAERLLTPPRKAKKRAR